MKNFMHEKQLLNNYFFHDVSKHRKFPLTHPFNSKNIDLFLNRKLASANKEITEPLLRELANTEEANRTGKMTVSVFIDPLYSIEYFYCVDYHFHPRSKFSPTRNLRLYRLCTSIENRRFRSLFCWKEKTLT